MNQLDKEFITSTVTTVVTREISKANNELEGKLKTFIVEHVSEEINGLAYMVVKGFERIDRKFDDRIDGLEANMNAKFEGVNRRIDNLDINTVRPDAFGKLEKRVTKLEKAAA